ncbi:hypothetical protein [Nakamurella leprariae]|uniref:LPXTG cell wall anchor domain-containing protein n=1 Tax=Nakamurella leprariae TaxID=2803911 RepID=A0A939C380_9ACTN|nr:hypothetical protein [Nakamurella leprariae]MBM9469119.1 hypothetical protein [Nakamurella leprariae]
MPIAFVAISGVATAAPTDDYPAPAPGAEPVVSAGGVGETAVVAVPANSFIPGEEVAYTIEGPSIGGGAGQAFPLKMETITGTAVAGADGSVAISFTPLAEGTYTVTFTGLTSGRSVSVSVPVGDDVAGPGDGDGDGDGNVGVVIGTNNGTVIINNGTLIMGDGFIANEPITVTVVYVNGDVETYAVAADNGGVVNFTVTPKHTGKTVVKVTGDKSGSWGSKTVYVEDETWTEVSSTTTAAYVKGASGTYASSSGLANTGASVAAPLAIGGTALVAGLGLLFFGTRGAIRRRGTHVSS